MNGGDKMSNKMYKNIIIGLALVAVVTAVAPSWAVWHQPKTPDCIA